MINEILKFIFPCHCVICDEVLPYGDKIENEFLCNECRDKIEFIKEPICKKCGAMIEDSDEAYCIRCKANFHENFEYGFGLLRYNDAVKESLHRIKYNGRKEYIDFYAKLIAKIYHDKIKSINPDFIVPVPIHKKRLIERNFNQASVLAYSISKELKKYGVEIEVNENLIFRNKNTKVLNILDSVARKNELNDAFKINDFEGISKILIIDDIYTTGGTIDTMSKVLKCGGAKEVYFVTISVVDNL